GELVTLRLPNLQGDDAPVPEVDAGDLRALQAGRTITVGSAEPDIDYRMRTQREGRGGGVIVLALPLDDVHDAVRRLVLVVVAAFTAVLAVLGLVIWWVIRLGVRPVQRMTTTAGAIAAGDLSQRVTEGTPGTEAGDLG